MIPKKQSGPSIRKRNSLRIGFVPLTDCAPLVIAQELGFFSKYGVCISLNRELGWATIREKIVYRELDAAHAVASMPVSVTLGLGSVRCDCLTALILSLNGNAITITNKLWRSGVRDSASLLDKIREQRRTRIFTFGVVSRFSSHNFLLRSWLSQGGIDPDKDLRIVVTPPPQMVTNLKAGNLDGFCAGEPWNSLAVESQVGWCAAVSAELDPGHPEKVLIVREDFAERQNEEHLALVAALLDACAFCELPENHEAIVSVLARPEYVGVPETVLRRGISGEFNFGHGIIRTIPHFNIFSGDGANEPCGKKAAWAIRHTAACGLIEAPPTLAGLHHRVFRTDLFEKASRLRMTSNGQLENENKTETELVAH